jgi:two-component system, OmpR family, osmolarity sensor histidine kinase EnvZ
MKPRSLLWRLGGLALAVSLLSLVLHVAVTTMWISPIGDELVSALAARIKVSRELLERTPASERDTLAARLADARFAIRRGEPPPPPAAASSGFALAPPGGFLVRLGSLLGSDFNVSLIRSLRMSDAQARLYASFSIDGQRWHVEHLARPPIEALLTTGLGWFMLAAAAVGVTVLGGMRSVVAPIREVAERIKTQGSSLQPLAEPARASAEVQGLVESFNRLAERVATADRTKKHLLAGVSHDLRTPLARLRLRIETQCEPRIAEAADGELRAIEHIVSQFLAYVHGHTGSVAGAGESVLAIINQVVASFAEQGVPVAPRLAAGDGLADALGLQRVLTNLIDNARVHGQAPIELHWRDNAAGERELSVWDHGAGLSDAQFASALQPFVRLSNDAGIGHCGLGLAIVAQIAQQWGARLECRREGNSRFGIALVWPQGAVIAKR